MRYVAIAAAAATFWLLVATLRLMVAGPVPEPLRPVPAPATPSVDPLPLCAYPGDSPLSKIAMVRGMDGVKPLIASCYEQHGVPGIAMVNVVIGKCGHVLSALVTGKFAGTPTGRCVEQAVRTAIFPPSRGLATPYPFQLR